VSKSIKGNGTIMLKGQAALVWLVQRGIMNHSFDFGIRMATPAGIQWSGFLVLEISERKREDSIQYNFLLLQEM
jgi:hypothetical protein